MNFFDSEIMTCLNHFSQHSWMFDQLIVSIADNNLFKGVVLVTIFWWAWFKREARDSHNREHILITLSSCIVAIALARSLAVTLPFRSRPIHEANLQFIIPYGENPTVLYGWSSFPSDHAVLFFTMAAGLLFISKPAGIFAIIYTVLFISLPRIYLGLHYPTDIIGGAVLGVAIALIANIYIVKSKIIQSVTALSDSKPGIFYSLFFLFTFQIADMFNDSRDLIYNAMKLIMSIIG